MNLSDDTDDIEHLALELAKITSLRAARNDSDTKKGRSRRTDIAAWLARLHQPHDVAEMAAAASDIAWKAFEYIEAIKGVFAADDDSSRKLQRLLRSLRAQHQKLFKVTVRLAIKEGSRSALSENARKGGNKRHANDPKQAAKQRIHELWKQWRRVDGRTWMSKEAIPSSRPKFADFARKQEPLIESTRVIVKWAKAWDEQRKAPK